MAAIAPEPDTDATTTPTVGEETERIAPVVQQSSGTATPRTRRRGFSFPRLNREPRLAMEDGDDVVVMELGEGLTRIGRSFQAEIELDDASVSRRHAMVVRDEHGVRILDDRSRNGIQVNGRRVTEARLEHDDVVSIGRVKLRFLAK